VGSLGQPVVVVVPYIVLEQWAIADLVDVQGDNLRPPWPLNYARDDMPQTHRPDAGTGEYVSPLVVKSQNSGEPALMAVVVTIDYEHSP